MSKREEIKDHVSKFVDGLTKLMRQAADEAVDLAFSEGEEAETAPVPVRASKKTRRAKRTPRETPIAAANDASDKGIIAAIRANPGCDARVIANAVGSSPAQIRPRLNELASTGAIKRTGMGRGTRYSPR